MGEEMTKEELMILQLKSELFDLRLKYDQIRSVMEKKVEILNSLVIEQNKKNEPKSEPQKEG